MKASAKSNRGPHGLRALVALVTLVVFLASGALVSEAQAEYGIRDFQVNFEEKDGSFAGQAGSHPFAVTTSFGLNDLGEIGPFEFSTDGRPKEVVLQQIAGLVGDATAIKQCSTEDFLDVGAGPFGNFGSASECADNTVVGVQATAIVGPNVLMPSGPVYNVTPPPGVAVRLAFDVLTVPVTVDVGIKPGGDYNVTATLHNSPQIIEFFNTVIQLWGVPADPGHDVLRGFCGSNLYEPLGGEFGGFQPTYGEPCSANTSEAPFLTLPGNCNGPQETVFETDSWEDPDRWVSGSTLTHNNAEPPSPQGFSGCNKLNFSPKVNAKATSANAGAGSGLNFDIDFNDEGLTSPDGLAQSTMKKAKITLPEGVTVDPSIAEGIGVCSPGDLANEKIDTAPGGGCPQDSKIGTVEVDTPLLADTIDGQVYLAKPYDNLAEDSLIAFYIVLKNAKNGILVKLPAKVAPDPNTGQLVTTVDEAPQLPFSHFHFHFREGQRAPLITPSACGTYTTEAELTPWARPDDPVTQLSTFEITGGVDGGPCPSGGVPPFDPSFSGGALNNAAAAYSQFDMRLLRSDGEQDLTKFSATLPPGVVGNLSGVGKCSDADVAAAKGKTGTEELASPSCPPNSQIGTTIAGAGVGTALTYVPGHIYLGGPYHGDPLSVIAITPAVAGPFDAGDVVVQEALTLNPATAEVEVDGSASDPIPHILKGIPLKLRELRVEVDRRDFTLNPTSCAPSSVKATLWGSFLDVLSPADDKPVDRSDRYQAADCQALGFNPHLGLHLKGGTRRGSYPGLKAVYTPKSGDANVKGLVVRLPRSAFLEQGHIRTICTRVQYAAESCPAAARYGYIKAWTPLLEEPLQGPVWLRSSNHKLPDLVFDLRGLVNVEVSTRIDSVHGGIRASVENAPDAPISRVLLHMQGGKKGLIVNSRNLCFKPGRNHANVQGSGQNGKQFAAKPLMQTRCSKARKHKRHQRRARRARVARASAAG